MRRLFPLLATVLLAACVGVPRVHDKPVSSAVAPLVATPEAAYVQAETDRRPADQSGLRLLTRGTNALMSRIALADQAARRAGQPPLGFVNPLLYRLAAGPGSSRIVHDVTTGSNDIGPGSPGGDGQDLGCCPAHRGYDQASGWGSLKVAAFSDAALSAGRR
jgi:hypothetical protein